MEELSSSGFSWMLPMTSPSSQNSIITSSIPFGQSPIDVCVEWDHARVPLAASVGCAVTRISSAVESSVPVTIKSTWASAAMVLRSCAPSEKRDAARLERTTNDFRTDSDDGSDTSLVKKALGNSGH